MAWPVLAPNLLPLEACHTFPVLLVRMPPGNRQKTNFFAGWSKPYQSTAVAEFIGAGLIQSGTTIAPINPRRLVHLR